jgi:Lrp/AsnC ligand binding domain
MLTAYVLIETEVGKVAHVAQALSDLDGVQVAEDLAGPYDVIARVQASGLDQLGRLVAARIQVVDGVTRTLTCMVIHRQPNDSPRPPELPDFAVQANRLPKISGRPRSDRQALICSRPEDQRLAWWPPAGVAAMLPALAPWPALLMGRSKPMSGRPSLARLMI